MNKTYILVHLLLSFLVCQVIVAQNPQEKFHYERFGLIEIETPYPIRSIDFNLQNAEIRKLKLTDPRAEGFLSSISEYGFFFQAGYEGELIYSVEEFGEMILDELRRRLNLEIGYMKRDHIFKDGFYGMKYSGNVLFHKKEKSLKSLIVADDSHIILLVFLYPRNNIAIGNNMERMFQSIQLYKYSPE